MAEDESGRARSVPRDLYQRARTDTRRVLPAHRVLGDAGSAGEEMITIAVPALVALVGLLIYALTAHKQVGLVVMGCGLLVAVYLVAGHVTRLG